MAHPVFIINLVHLIFQNSKLYLFIFNMKHLPILITFFIYILPPYYSLKCISDFVTKFQIYLTAK